MRYAALLVLLAAASAADISAVDQLRKDFYTLEHGLWRNVTSLDWNTAGLGGDVELTKAFVAFDKRIEAASRPPRVPSRNFLWSKAVKSCQVIDGFYDNFVAFIRRQAQPGAVPAPVREWLDLAERVLLDPDSSVTTSVRKLDNLLEHGDVFRTVRQGDESDLCELEVSPHQLIYDMYSTISLTEIKGYAMMQFSWMLLRVYEKGNYTQEASITRKRYAERTSRTAVAAREALSQASRDVYRCYPTEHKSGETYAEVTRLLQGYVENEVDLNGDGTCRENCAYYTLATRKGCYDPNGLCTKQTECRGRVINCQYIDSDMWICPASRSSSRRYEYIEYENSRTLGKADSHCRLGITKVDSWWRWLFWHCSYCMCLCDESGPTSDRYFSLWSATSDVKNNKLVDSWWRWLVHCSYCMCLCDESGPTSDRYFSLWSATSDVKNNKVVTGVRLVKHGQVFHLQVSDGVLGARGNVTPSGWVPVQKFGVYDVGVREGEDYHMLTYEKRAIDLDELDSPAGHVLTGVRFRMLGAHLHFEIRATLFNYTTGRLSPERSEWISNDNTDGGETPRVKLELMKPDIPTRSLHPLHIDSKHDQYVEFTNSDLDADAAQSTVPFIDIQPLQPMKGAALLSGAGVFHRGAPNNGGFIALKVLSYDQSRHVRAQPPPREEEEADIDLGLAASN